MQTINQHRQGFSIHHGKLLSVRLKHISYMLILTYPLFFIVDFFLVNRKSHPFYHQNLTLIHLAGMISGIIYIAFRRYIPVHRQPAVNAVYACFFLILGAASSLNSQLLTGNINAYVIIVIGTAALLPLRPVLYFFLAGTIQLIFVTGLSFLKGPGSNLLMNQINSTGAAVISIVIAYTFYTFQQKDYRSQIKLHRQEKSFRQLFHMNPNPLILTDLASRNVLLMNNQAFSFFQIEELPQAGLDGSFLFEDPEIMVQLLQQRAIYNHLMEQPVLGGKTRWVMANYELVDYLGATCILTGLTDVSFFKDAESEMMEHATKDDLTGAKNRRSGMAWLEENTASGQTAAFTVCFIDINNLKIVNDQQGHAAGDSLIKMICSIINRHLEENDLLFRMGGDEFVVIFKEKSPTDVQKNWIAIQTDFEAYNQADRPFLLSASHGLCYWEPGSGMTPEQIIAAADREMYREKFRMKNGIHS